MISKQQIQELSKKYKINQSIVSREYIQLLFLKELYKQGFSKDVFFKGGTAIRLLYNGERFSEDLDFTVTMEKPDFDLAIKKFFSSIENQYTITFKERKTLTGKTFLLTAKIEHQKHNIFVKLDFSMREAVLEPTQNIIKTDYPIVMHNFINSLSIDEILSEKIRATMTRKKHRDLYDLWILQEQGAKINKTLISEKLKYYDIKFSAKDIVDRLSVFSKEKFILDLRPFMPINERDGLGKLFEYIKVYLSKSFLDK